MKPIRGGLLLTLAAAVSLLAPAAAGATWPGGNGRIAYVRDADGVVCGLGISSIRPDGSGDRSLTRHCDSQPSWSANGKRIVFVGDNDHNVGTSFTQVFTMRANGQGQTRVTHDGGAGSDHSPSFSPNGRRIVYTHYGVGDGKAVSIVTIRADGTDRHVLLRLKLDQSPRPESVSPTFSPNGNRVVFGGELLQRHGILSIRTDGSDLRRLTRPRRPGSPTDDVYPYWAPDGDHILFWRCPDGDCEEAILWIVRAHGSNERPLANTVAGHNQPSVISPSGDLFAFENLHQNCNDEPCWSNIAVAPPGSFASQDVTHNSGAYPFRFATQPSWQPIPAP